MPSVEQFGVLTTPRGLPAPYIKSHVDAYGRVIRIPASKALPTADDTTLAPAMLVMLHGMGMGGSRQFEDFVSGCCGPSTGWLQKVFPKAVPRAEMPGVPSDRWFDMNSTLVLPNDEHDGLSESVEVVHDILKKAEDDGIPSSRILVGGFSQGAVVALVAGLTYENPIAGVCMFSGWFPAIDFEDVHHWNTPILMCHGSNDTLIPASTGSGSAQLLRVAGADNVDFTSFASTKHEFGTAPQRDTLTRFLGDKLRSIDAREKVMSESETTDAGSEIPIDLASELSVNEYICTYRSSALQRDEILDSDDEVEVTSDVELETCTRPDYCVLQ